MTEASRELLLRLVRADADDSIAVGDDEWLPLVRLGEALDVLGLVALAVSRRDLVPPTTVRGKLEIELRKIRRHHAFHFIEGARVATTLQAAGVKGAIIKGAALSRLVYDDAAARSFRDLDVLVFPRDRDAAIAALCAEGYAEELNASARAAYRSHHFHVVLRGPGKPFVEIHWAVTRPDDPYRVPTEWLLEDLAALPGAEGVLVPHADAHVLIAAASLMRDGFRELKPLLDIDRLVRAGRPVRWDRVARMAEQGGLARTLRAALELCVELLGTPAQDALARLPALGRARQRLDEISFWTLPLTPAEEARAVEMRLAQFWLTPAKGRAIRNFILRNAFERAQQRGGGIGALQRAIGVAKRTAHFAAMAAHQARCALFASRASAHESRRAAQT